MTSPEGGTEFRVEKIAEVMPQTAEPRGQQAEPPAAPSGSPPAPAQSERLSGLLDGRGWKLGYESKQANQEITEYVLPGETVGNWTELVSIQAFPGAQNRATPGGVMLGAKEQTLKKCPKTTWNVIHESSNQVLFEYLTAKCRGVDDEHELIMIFLNDRALYQVSYASKKLPVTEAQRTQWIAIIEKVVASGSFP